MTEISKFQIDGKKLADLLKDRAPSCPLCQKKLEINGPIEMEFDPQKQVFNMGPRFDANVQYKPCGCGGGIIVFVSCENT